MSRTKESVSLDHREWRLGTVCRCAFLGVVCARYSFPVLLSAVADAISRGHSARAEEGGRSKGRPPVGGENVGFPHVGVAKALFGPRRSRRCAVQLQNAGVAARDVTASIGRAIACIAGWSRNAWPKGDSHLCLQNGGGCYDSSPPSRRGALWMAIQRSCTSKPHQRKHSRWLRGWAAGTGDVHTAFKLPHVHCTTRALAFLSPCVSISTLGFRRRRTELNAGFYAS